MCDAMTTEVFVHCITMRLSVVLNDLTDLGVADSWSAYVYSRPHRLASHLRKTLDVRVHNSEHDHSRVVSMMPLIVADDVDVEVLAVLENLGVRHTMCHHIVHRGAY